MPLMWIVRRAQVLRLGQALRAAPLLALLLPTVASAANGGLPEPPALAGIPIDFILFAITLMGVALFHHHTLKVAVTGLAVITVFKVLVSPFPGGAGVAGLMSLLLHEWVLLTNLLG